MASVSVRPRALPRVGVLAGTAGGSAVLVGLLLAASLYMRTRSFHAAFWIDEGLSWGISSHPFFDIPSVLRQDGSPPFYYMLLHVWMRLTGPSVEETHALSLIFALGTIPVGFSAGRSLFGPRAGWICAVLCAFDPYITMYGQETRMYSLMAVLALGGAACFLHAFVGRRRAFLAPLALILALLVYTHNWGFFFVAGALTALALVIWQAEERRPLLVDGALCFGGAALLFVPWLPTLAFQIRHTGAPWAEVPAVSRLTHSLSMVLGGDRQALVLLLAAGAGLAAALTRPRRREQPSAALVLVVLTAGTLVWAWAFSQVSPAWAYRYFAVFVGPLMLVAAVGLARARGLGLAGLAIVLTFWLPYHSLGHKSNDRHMIRSVAAQLRPGDLVLATHPEQVPVLHYYMPGGMRYATTLGPVPDPGVMDWRDALDRLEKATPRKDLEPLVASLPPGRHLLFMRPVIGGGDAWGAPWTKLVRQTSAEWGRALEQDGRLRRVGRFPRFRHGETPRGMRAVLYTKLGTG